MADGSSPEKTNPPAEKPQALRLSRRGLLGMFASLGLVLASKPTPVSAQTPGFKPIEGPKPAETQKPKPADSKEKVPEKLKQKIEDAVEKARNYIGRKNIPIQYKTVDSALDSTENKSSGVHAVPDSAMSELAGQGELSGWKLEVYHNPEPTVEDTEYFSLRAVAEIGRAVNQKSINQNYPEGELAGKFRKDFIDYTKLDINHMSLTSATVIPPGSSFEGVLENELIKVFDFNRYIDKNNSRSDPYERGMGASEKIYSRGLALWLLKSDELVKKVEALSDQPEIRAIIAKVFLSILKHSSNFIPTSMAFEEASAVDPRNLDRMLEMCGDERLREFFGQKRQYSEILPKAA